MFIPSAVLISWTCLRTELLPSVLVAMSLSVPVSNKAIQKISFEMAFRGGLKECILGNSNYSFVFAIKIH